MLEPVPATDRDRGLLVRSLLALGVAFASIAYFFAMLFARHRDALIERNELLARARAQMIGWTLASGLLAILVGFVFWIRRRDKPALSTLDALARLLSPLVLLGLLPGLLLPWSRDLELAITLGAFVFMFERLMRLHLAARAEFPAFARARAALDERLTTLFPPQSFLRRQGMLFFIVACAVGYAAYTSLHTVWNHERFNTFDYDLGQLDNLFFNALKGHPMRCTPLIREGNWSELRNHAELSTYFFLPVYALAPRAETLLILQSTVIGLGAVPLYRFSARRLPRGAAAAVAIAYLFYAPMNEANYFDFHYQPVACGIILWMIDFFDEGRTWLFGLFFVIAIGCREDISVGLAVFGIFLVLTGNRFRWGVGIIAVASAYFVAMRFFIMPSFGQWGFQDIYKDLFPGNDHSFKGVILTLLSNPLYTFTTLLTEDKLRYILQILVPVAFLPLRRPQLWLALIPGAFFTLLTTRYPPTTEISFQYSGHFAAYLFPAAALALASQGRDLAGQVARRAGVAALVAGTLLTTAHWGGIPLRDGLRAGFSRVNPAPPTAEDKQKAKDLAELVAMVPPEAALAASDRELPHVSNRLTCFTLFEGYEGADYIIYVPHTGGRDGTQAQRALDSGDYVQIAARPQLSLLKRTRSRGPVPPAAK